MTINYFLLNWIYGLGIHDTYLLETEVSRINILTTVTHYCSWVLKTRILKCFAIPFFRGPRLFRTFIHYPFVLGVATWHGMAQSFIELNKAVIHVVTLVSFLWLWFSFCLHSDAFSYCSWSSQGKNSEVVCHSLLQWTAFYVPPEKSVCRSRIKS